MKPQSSSFLKTCMKSILKQNYLNYEIIVCYDDNNRINDLNEYTSHPKISTFKLNKIDLNDNFVNNLYRNDLFIRIKDEWLLFIDDDDEFVDDMALDIIRQGIQKDDDMIFWKVKKGNQLIYPKNINKIGKNDIIIQCVCFHSKYLMTQIFQSKLCIDVYFITKILPSEIFNRKFADMVLIKKQQMVINIIGLKNITCSISDNLYILKNYMKTIHANVSIHILDIKDINIQQLTHNTVKNNIFCIQPFEIAHRGNNLLTIINSLNIVNKKPSVLWVWEFKSLPKIFKYYEKYFEKIYVPSQFCYEIFSKYLTISIEKLPLTSRIHEYINKIPGYDIQNKNINIIIKETEGNIRIGYCFDINSSIVRKNPLNLIKAFSSLRHDNRVLILKYRLPRTGDFTNRHEEQLFNECIRIASSAPNIYLINEELDAIDLYKLYTYFDYYISPHCGEGFGITIYDNMILGNKIISPYYSGEKEYLNRNEIVELEYEEREIYELKEHPIYGQMINYKGAYISVNSIINAIVISTIKYKT